MIWIDVRGWVNLQAVVVLIGVFKKAVHWIEHFMRQEKKPLSRTQQQKLQDFNFIVRQWINLLNYQTIFLTSTFTLTQEVVSLSQMNNNMVNKKCHSECLRKTGNCRVYQDLHTHTEYQSKNTRKTVITTFSLLSLPHFYMIYSSSMVLRPWPPCCQGFQTVDFLWQEDVSPMTNIHLGEPGYRSLSCTLQLPGMSGSTSC